MRKSIIYSVMMSVLLVACSTRHEPACENPNRIVGENVRSQFNEYEGLYNTIYSQTIQDILELDDIDAVLRHTSEGYFDIYDTSFYYLSQIVSAYYLDGTLFDLMDDAITTNGLSLDIENYQVNPHIMVPLISAMMDSVYVTPSYRYTIFNDDVYLHDEEKFALCVYYAVNNRIYDSLYGQTVVIRDDIHNQYATMQFPKSYDLPIQWIQPCDIYELPVNDISSIDTAVVYERIVHEIGMYKSFTSHEERVQYFSQLESNHTIYNVTSQECEEQREESIDDLETEIALAVIVTAATSADALPAVSCVYLVYYYAQRNYIEKQYKRCLENAED